VPLRQAILASPETLSDVLVAADDRYREAEELLVGQHFDGCVYLLGYSVEMWLKSACLRLRNVPPFAAVKPVLGPLKSWMKGTAPHVPFTNYHDLAFLGQCVVHLRLAQGRPLAAALHAELQRRIIVGFHDEWIVDMRYRRAALTAAEAWAALDNAWWMKSNWTQLL